MAKFRDTRRSARQEDLVPADGSEEETQPKQEFCLVCSCVVYCYPT